MNDIKITQADNSAPVRIVFAPDDVLELNEATLSLLISSGLNPNHPEKTKSIDLENRTENPVFAEIEMPEGLIVVVDNKPLPGTDVVRAIATGLIDVLFTSVDKFEKELPEN